MLRLSFATLALAAVLVPTASFASLDQRPAAFVLCKNQKSVRTLQVNEDAANRDGCVIKYSKGGVEQVVGSNRSLTTCKSILKSIQANLESSRWNCRTVQSALVSTSREALTQ